MSQPANHTTHKSTHSRQQAETMVQQRLPLPKGREAIVGVLADGLYRQDKVQPLEAYLQEQVSALMERLL